MSINPDIKSIKQYSFFKQLKKLPFVEAIYLYGSRARGDFLEYSDIDLAIVCPNASTEDWFKIEEIIEEAAILNKIELKRYDKLKNDLFKKQIDKYKKVLYAKN